MINLDKIKGVIFDLDGVLVDTEEIQPMAWILALKNYGVSLSKRDFFCYRGKSAEVIENEIKERYHLPIKKGELSNKRDKYILQIFKKSEVKLLPYALEIVKLLSSQKKLAIASTGSRKEILLKLKKARLYQYFPVIVSRDDVRKGKPSPDIYLVALKKMNLKPENCLAFEDSQSGLEAAKSAGLACYAITNRLQQKQDFSKADKVFSNFREILSQFRVNYSMI